MQHIKDYFQKSYAENSRETFRRQTLHQLEQAGIVDKNPSDPLRATNSPKTDYAVSETALTVVREFGAAGWKRAVGEFRSHQGSERTASRRRKRGTIAVTLSEGKVLRFSPGKHNELQGLVLTVFRQRFCPDATVLYVGDTSNKLLHVNAKMAADLRIRISKHDKLPDIIMFDAKKRELLIVEVVTSHGPVSRKRFIELEEWISGCAVDRIYVSAFPDFTEFKRHLDDLAWDTEAWIAQEPSHLVHYNGPKFCSRHR